MPKNKKPAPFMSFVMEYKKKFPNMTLECAISQADNEWRKMSNEQKSVYKSRSTISNKPCEKYSSQGVPLSQLEKEKQEAETQERLIKKEIQDTVTGARLSDTLSSHKFYIIMANYFVRNADNLYVPAEISLCEYSLKDGITNKYHSFVNLEVGLGHAYEAVEHAKKTHNLPLPPNAFGEKNVAKLYLAILKFIQAENGTNKIPPVYTIDSSLPVLKSILSFLQEKCSFEMPCIRVFSLHYLFYILKKNTSEIGKTKQFNSIHITNAILDRDYYEYQSGIACEYHESIDKTNYCALSYVIRWAYTLSDNMCMDLGITLKPGIHVSTEADLTITSMFDFNDTESEFSSKTWSTNFTQPKIETSFYTDKNSSISVTGEHFLKINMNNNNSDKMKLSQQSAKDIDESLNETANDLENLEITDDDDNPWLMRHKNKPREPNEDSFNFDINISRGRGMFLYSKNDSFDSECNKSGTKSRGRGYLFDCSFASTSNSILK